MVRQGYERTEANVRYQLISSLLKHVPHSMASLVPSAYNEDRDVYASSPTVEKQPIDEFILLGQNPGVDYYFVRFTEAMNIFLCKVTT